MAFVSKIALKFARLFSIFAFKPSAVDLATGLKQGLLVGIAAGALLLASARSEPPAGAQALDQAAPYPAVTQRADSTPEQRAVFVDEVPSATTKSVADWVADSRDHDDRVFAVLDKVGARLCVFDSAAKLIGSSMVLVGSAIGDKTLPAVRDKPLSAIRSEVRTTPAGRFVSEAGHDSAGEAALWVDDDAAVAVHRVQEIDPKERRFERIATSSAEDKQISNGCVNVPWAFFEQVARPVLGASRGMVYVLPEVKPSREVVPRFCDVSVQHRKGG